jgi:hypothetical protein
LDWLARVRAGALYWLAMARLIDRYQGSPRELRRQLRRRSERTLMALVIGAGALAVMVFLLGRGMLGYLQQVSDFAATLEQKSPAVVKEELRWHARRLDHPNPAVRSAAIAAMKAATGMDFGDDVEAWRAWWRDNEATWEYKPPGTRPEPGRP